MGRNCLTAAGFPFGVMNMSQNYIVEVVTQDRECTKCHWITHLKIANGLPLCFVNAASIKIQKKRRSRIPRSVFFGRKSSASLLSSLQRESWVYRAGKHQARASLPTSKRLGSHMSPSPQSREQSASVGNTEKVQRGFLSLWTNSGMHFCSHLNALETAL